VSNLLLVFFSLSRPQPGAARRQRTLPPPPETASCRWPPALVAGSPQPATRHWWQPGRGFALPAPAGHHRRHHRRPRPTGRNQPNPIPPTSSFADTPPPASLARPLLAGTAPPWSRDLGGLGSVSPFLGTCEKASPALLQFVRSSVRQI
jgi:hypothetical protein